MNTLKDYVTIHLRLIQIDVSKLTLNDLSYKVCVPNKTEDLNLSVFNMITGINESKSLTKHISWKCKCKFDGRKYNSNQNWNNNKCWFECVKHHICQKKLFGTLLQVVAKVVNIKQVLLSKYY